MVVGGTGTKVVNKSTNLYSLIVLVLILVRVDQEKHLVLLRHLTHQMVSMERMDLESIFLVMQIEPENVFTSHLLCIFLLEFMLLPE
jgi:hypothetical protein